MKFLHENRQYVTLKKNLIRKLVIMISNIYIQTIRNSKKTINTKTYEKKNIQQSKQSPNLQINRLFLVYNVQ